MILVMCYIKCYVANKQKYKTIPFLQSFVHMFQKLPVTQEINWIMMLDSIFLVRGIIFFLIAITNIGSLSVQHVGPNC